MGLVSGSHGLNKIWFYQLIFQKKTTLRLYPKINLFPSHHQGQMSEQPLFFPVTPQELETSLALGVHVAWIASVYKTGWKEGYASRCPQYPCLIEEKDMQEKAKCVPQRSLKPWKMEELFLPSSHLRCYNKNNDNSDDKHYTLDLLCQALYVKSILLLSLI